ncbi:MAG: hypothetical protein QM723_32520 [Myxococcaceae bacterium]
MKRALSIALLFTLAGCPSKVKTAEGELRFTGHQLDFGTVFVGHPAEKTVELTDTTNAPADGLLATGIPEVVVTPFMAHSNGGETILARVTWSPRDAGTLTGYLSLESGDSPDLMALSGTALVPPACPQAPCHESSFDPDAGRCVVALLPDGTACPDDPCLSGGTCHGGTCQGAARDCDDHDACTLDSCGDQGCMHVGIAGSCPMPSDPCQAAACDSDAGCIGVPLSDGTPCGPNDCVTARICVAGSCVDRAAPNGSICAPASLCQDAGVCIQGSCQQPPALPLTPRWFHTPETAGVINAGPLPLDDDGNLYFSETLESTCNYVSLDPNGVLRWRAETGLQAVCTPVAVDQPARQLYVIQSGDFEARSLDDGSIRWRLTAAEVDGGMLGASGTPILSGHQSTGALLIVRPNVEPTLVVDRLTGTLLRNYPASETFALGDGSGHFLGTVPDGGVSSYLITLDSIGNAGGVQQLDDGLLITAISGDTLVLQTDSLSSTELWSISNAMATARHIATPMSPVIVTDSHSFWIDRSGSTGETLLGFDLTTGAPRPPTALGFVGFQPALFATDRATVLAVYDSSMDTLVEADTRGVERMSCPVYGNGTVAFDHERLYLKASGSLSATDLPGLSPAAAGWVQSGGNAHGDHQPR